MLFRLLDHLCRQHVSLGQYISVLDQEAAALQNGHYDALPALVKRKVELGTLITQLDLERQNQQVTLGYSADRTGADALAAAGDQALQSAWQLLQARAQSARERNHRNGVMVHTLLDFTRQAMRAAQPGSQALYGPDGGHAPGRSQGQRLASG
jgi:flagella synthesis protein FlgN